MRPAGYAGPVLINDLTHPITLVAFLIVLALGVGVILLSWFC